MELNEFIIKHILITSVALKKEKGTKDKNTKRNEKSRRKVATK